MHLKKLNNQRRDNESIFSNLRHYSTCDESSNCTCRCIERHNKINEECQNLSQLRHSRCENFSRHQSIRNDERQCSGVFSQNQKSFSRREEYQHHSVRSNAEGKYSTDASTVKKFGDDCEKGDCRIVVDGVPVRISVFKKKL